MDETRKTALVVSADSKLRDRIALTLSYEGFAIKIADNRQHGLQMLSECAPNVLLLDVGLPGFDAAEFEQSMLIHNPIGRLIMITPGADVKNALLRPSQRRKVLAAPFDAAALINAVANLKIL